ncbi:NAD(FAD)-utilizing dehydrogenase [Terrihabitans soli]|uniref:NAD(FAD)-utilizing dehydrogenase n=1 Tax=Terrihabitans soli TaxID=708113 RepID=A0A6S6QUZ2_9HYPH|nr:TIGR03862 family flavoprotein [Terrihabitans soli]BCJ90790.1 NAD(FAD)-utilizing dehydrogenase [Terrihabitans soli]
MTDIAVIGGGPAGLMAAERLAQAGCRVSIYDRMPSLGRKLLMAGRGGLNLTHSEPFDIFLTRYSTPAPQLEAALRAFPPEALRTWAAGLGEETFAGSSGRVFPKSFKASPLLRALLRRLEALGVRVHTRHAWTGFSENGVVFATPQGEREVRADAVVLALGGASWPRLGADGGWTKILTAKGVPVTPLAPSNCGVRIDWSETFRSRFSGTPLKRIAVEAFALEVAGELVVTDYGLEGGALYALTPVLRDALSTGETGLAIDLRPDLDEAGIVQRLSHPRRGATLTNFLRKALKLSPIQTGLLRESGGRELPTDPAALARLIKHVQLKVTGLQGLERAISTAGGIPFAAVTDDFELQSLPGVFVAGEMLDWEAPTGGYLLQASFATGIAAAAGVLARSGAGG